MLGEGRVTVCWRLLFMMGGNMSRRTDSLQVEDAFSLRRLDEPEISPDGRCVAFTVGGFYKPKDARRGSRLWLISDGTASGLTQGPGTDGMPRWSPIPAADRPIGGMSGDLAFVSDRSDPDRGVLLPYILKATGGEARPVEGIRGKVEDMHWLPDGRRLLLLVEEPETEEERQRRKDKRDWILFEREDRCKRLWLADVETGEASLISPQGLHIWEFDLSCDGEQVVVLCSDRPQQWAWYRARLEVFSLADCPEDGAVDATKMQSLFVPPPDMQLAAPTWCPNGERVAFLSCTCSDPGIVTGDVWVAGIDVGDPVKVVGERPISVNWLEWDSSEELLVSGYEEGLLCLARVVLHPDGQVTYDRLWRDAVSAVGSRARFSRTARGDEIVMTLESTQEAGEVWLADLDEKAVSWSRLTSINREASDWTLGEVETLHWVAPDGLKIQGLLVKPPDYEAGKRYPLVVNVHGGPTALHSYRFHAVPFAWAQLMAVRGCCVLLPNPRGSSGWGTEFSNANVGDLGGGDFADVMAGVDHCVNIGVADPERMGIGGGSYGGYLTAWAITQTDRFRAAVMVAGIVNLLSFHGTTNIPYYTQQFYAGDPYRDPIFAERSPMTHVNRVETPTLIVHGEKDPCCQVGQAMEFYRALDGRVPVEMVIYPREGHGIRERQHLEHFLGTMLNWFDTHLLDEE